MSINFNTIIEVLQQEVGNFSPKLERLIHTREWARILEFVDDKPLGFGRPRNDRGVLSHAFLAKAIYLPHEFRTSLMLASISFIRSFKNSPSI
jgi:hypothetical protein